MDKELLEVAYFLSRCGKDNPPSILNVKSWKEAYELFSYELNEEKTIAEFRNSLKNYRDHFDSHLDNERTGWKKNNKPEPLSLKALEVFNELKDFSDLELWERISKYTSIRYKNQSEKKNLFWTFDINAFRLIGSQLISDKFTAIIELVKNCYDANATEVKIDFINSESSENGKIILQDNGHGMNSDQIENSWMKIGTNTKRLTDRSPKPFERVFLGEKGIGRFAIEKISDKVNLISKEINVDDINILEIDWNIYSELSKKNDEEGIENKKKFFTSIPNQLYLIKYDHIEYIRIKEKISSHGTILEFNDLKEVWTQKDIERLKKELSKFISPFSDKYSENKFNIYIRADKYESSSSISKYEKLLNNSLNFATFKQSIGYNKENNVQEELYFNEETNEIEVIKSNIYNFGPINLYLYYYDLHAKRRFSAANKGEDIKLDGFKIYRDNILATPFVEKADVQDSDAKKGVSRNRDVLGLDSRRYSGFFSKISSRDYLGFIEITKKDNPGIKDLTNRQEFESTKEYKELKDFIVKQLEVVETKLGKEKEEKNEQSQEKFESTFELAKNILSKLSSLEEKESSLKDSTEPLTKEVQILVDNIKLGKDQLKNLKDDLQKEREIFTRLISLQEFAADLSHTVRNSIDILTDFSDALLNEVGKDTEAYEYASEIDKEIRMLMDLVNYMLDYANSGKNIEKFDISKFIIDTFNRYKKRFEKTDIEYDITNINDTLMINHSKVMIKEIFDNLISNSIRSLNKTKNRKRIIKCTTYIEDDSFILLFSDSGIGIAPNVKHKIYDLRYTTTAEEGGGGIGLYKIKTSLKTLHGDIQLIDSEFNEYGCTFKIILPLERKNEKN